MSSDGGKTWIDAPFIGPDLGRFAWRQFAMPLRMAAGNYVVTSRATDQPATSSPSSAARTRGGYSQQQLEPITAVKVAVV